MDILFLKYIISFHNNSYQEMKIISITLCLLIVALTQKPPVWPVRFQQGFVQSWSKTQTHDFGGLWYDSQKEMSRLDRNNGKYDQFCNSIVDGVTPCSQIVREKKRYVVFPALKICCFCCDSDHGCGILRRDWLRNTTFAGVDELSGQFFNKFVDEAAGIQYWTTTDAQQIPRKLAEDKAIFKDFIMSEYSQRDIPESVFALPSYCKDAICPSSSVCGKFRGQRQ